MGVVVVTAIAIDAKIPTAAKAKIVMLVFLLNYFPLHCMSRSSHFTHPDKTFRNQLADTIFFHTFCAFNRLKKSVLPAL